MLISEDPRIIECDGCGNAVESDTVTVILTKTSFPVFAFESVPPDVLTAHPTGADPDSCVGKAAAKLP
jgi:hypothetical protein